MHRQHPVLAFSDCRRCVDPGWDAEARGEIELLELPCERRELARRRRALCLERQSVVLDFDVEVLVGYARDIGDDENLISILKYVDRGRDDSAGVNFVCSVDRSSAIPKLRRS